LSHVYCPECGFQNPEAANYCSKCGSLLRTDEPGEQTMTLSPEELAEDSAAALQDLGGKGPALVVRSGGGRAGESFLLSKERTLVGRSPECDVFLDDVTVSRRHSHITRDGDRITIEDLGSLNGTFVNRRRIESAELEDDDELQIGKYRLTFLRR
jgi:pSer/pThr/pTyr-binding forkhead associated (FHA) protein